jgi:heat shock protein HslJ
MRKLIRNLLMVPIVLFFTFSIQNGQEGEVSNLSLVGRWMLIAINEQSVSEEIFAEGIPYIEIKEKDRIFSGFTGCNLIQGQYNISGNTIAIGKIISSKRYCENIPEQSFLEALEQSEAYSINGTALYLINKETRLLGFIKQK